MITIEHNVNLSSLEQARESLFALEQVNEAYKNRIAELQAVNSILSNLAASGAERDVFAEAINASKSLLAFDEAFVVIPSGNGELYTRASTISWNFQLPDTNVLRKVRAGRALTSTARHLFASAVPECISEESSVLCLPVKLDGNTGIVVLIRRPYETTDFRSSDVEKARNLGVLITQALTQISKQEAQAENRAKSTFLATMSHELRTPLNGVIGMTSILQETQLTEEQRQCADTIETCGNSLLNLIEDILEFSNSDIGHFELSSEVIDTATTMNETADIVRFQAEKKGLAVTIDCAPELPSQFVGDGRRIRQVLLNLLQNAIKFTDAGSISLVGTSRVSDRRRMVHFSVADTGIGVPEGSRANLFEDFYQVDSSLTRQYGGVGLGLAISRRIVEKHGGSIGFESNEGSGSTFWFEVPAGEPESLVQVDRCKGPEFGSYQGEELSILVAEDSSINRQVARTILEAMGHSVTLCDDGRQAVALCKSNRFDVVLMDMQMPEMDGLQATRQIRTLSEPSCKVPIIALTANAFESDRNACFEAGMTGFASKPISKQKLQEALEAARPSMRLVSEARSPT